ncbi:DNA repair protein RadA [Ilumatobacter coccineus]|uniref:DNA repair protein RadA n=1 Tax=Ilumatobacter coccineus (strain NBRC 103263 / KCTC 29153 / YM16-304) TaxID=1313172 RepID=A0A6C7EC20_ILUCY|nr:DNA repair protein RadA [Ilumatobacter coccineus]BAN04021.1 DNA repair protein RadA [Ilumatobacter coccineus YM16-304]
MAGKSSKIKTTFACTECGAQSPKWAGRCTECGDWNTLVEEITGGDDPADLPLPSTKRSGPMRIGDVPTDLARPISTGIDELDTVLGGGLVAGSVTLLGGEPGIGKSTLLLQLLAARSGTTLYVSAEESGQQVRLRAERLDAIRPDLWLHAETALPHIIQAIDDTQPELVVIDSIQTVADPALSSPPGSVGQVRGCAHRLVTEAKDRNIAIVLVGHVTKDGNLAGPRVLEHVVDTVLQFEGDRHHALRLLRAVKHRFGPTNELGLFEMVGAGLVAVPDPSTLFLADRRTGVPGSAVVPTMEGRRPIVLELQALTNEAMPNVPARRSAQGLDSGRMSMLMAVLGRRGRLKVGEQDIYASAVGGAKVTEPGLDLGLCLAVASAMRDTPLPADLAVFGEVGLGGEVRQVSHAQRRVTEAARLGFKRVIVPAKSPEPDDELGAQVRLIRVQTVIEALRAAGLDGSADSGLRAV